MIFLDARNPVHECRSKQGGSGLPIGRAPSFHVMRSMSAMSGLRVRRSLKSDLAFVSGDFLQRVKGDSIDGHPLANKRARLALVDWAVPLRRAISRKMRYFAWRWQDSDADFRAPLRSDVPALTHPF